MLPIAGQTAGPNGLHFFVDTQGFQIVFQIFLVFNFFYPLATTSPSASNN